MVQSVNRVLLAVCALSLLINVAQYSASFTTGIECADRVARTQKRLDKCDKKREKLTAKLREANGGKAPAEPAEAPPCECPKCDDKAVTKGDDADEPAAASPDNDVEKPPNAVGKGELAEIGWELGLERKASKTPNTVYEPAQDAALAKHAKRYGRSPVPKGSWKVRVADNKWVTMDEVAFAYDVWFEENQRFQYMSWMGVFVQQDPIDAFAIQDMLWRTKPDLVIEIGTNTGGGAIFYATIMKAYNKDAKIVTLDVKPVSNWNQRNNDKCVGCYLGTEHPWWSDGMINFVQGRVTEQATRDKVQKFVDDAKKVLVIEDASHRYPDTLENIEATYHWVSPGSYLLVQDTKMDRFVAGLGRKYGRYKFGPMRSVDEFMAKHSDKFVIDRRFEYLLYSQHHRGWLKRKAD